MGVVKTVDVGGAPNISLATTKQSNVSNQLDMGATR